MLTFKPTDSFTQNIGSSSQNSNPIVQLNYNKKRPTNCLPVNTALNPVQRIISQPLQRLNIALPTTQIRTAEANTAQPNKFHPIFVPTSSRTNQQITADQAANYQRNNPDSDSTYSTKSGFILLRRENHQNSPPAHESSKLKPIANNLQPITSQDPKYILTNRPMTFQKASGKILLPATLNYGFEPITPATEHYRARTTPTPSPGGKVKKRKYSGYVKHRKDTTIIEFYQEENVLDRITSLLDPLRKLLS